VADNKHVHRPTLEKFSHELRDLIVRYCKMPYDDRLSTAEMVGVLYMTANEMHAYVNWCFHHKDDGDRG